MTRYYSSIVRVHPPARAEHIGSLLRPAVLYKKRELYEQHRCSRRELKQAEDGAIKDVLRLQREVGMKTFTDGELRR
jgi:methionine synthase II (cobalamin-independent)